MSQTPQAAAPPAAIGRGSLLIVLFGLPDAGKSSLLGALAQAGQTQEHLLNGHLTDVSRGLAELQQRVYDERPRETLEEVVPYPVRFEVFAEEPGQAKQRLEAVLVDCDGRVANELLSRRRSLDSRGNEGTLANAIVHADALVLVVDASAKPEQVDADFKEFGRFLRFFEQARGKRSEVGGLPVFLVLTKCDLLAQPNDTLAQWQERIEAHKAQVEKRFRDFLSRQEEEGPTPFGSIELELWSTAVKRPSLSGSAPRPRDPYQVAELFRECLGAARDFRCRRLSSGRRLRWTVAGAAAILIAMVGLSVAMFASRETDRPVGLENRIAYLRGRDEALPISVRYREQSLPERITELTDLRKDPDFPRLPAEQRQYVEERVQELQAYRDFLGKLRDIRPPTDARKDAELDAIQARLDELSAPAPYQEAWERTEAVQLQRKWQADLKAIRSAVPEVQEWYVKLRRRGEDLRLFLDTDAGDGSRVPWNEWPGRVDKLLAEAQSPRYPPGEKLPGSVALSGWPEVTYATVERFAPVIQAKSDWEELKRRLSVVRNRASEEACALGLITNQPGKPPLLQIPKDLTAEQVRPRLQRLEQEYPGYKDWTIPNDLPESAANDLRRAARASYDNLLKAGQDVVLRQLQRLSPDGKETPERWRQLRTGLGSVPELADWNKLAAVLIRFFEPTLEDPAASLANFLRQDHFDLELNSISLQIPDDLKVRPVGRLTIYHGPGADAKPALTLKAIGESKRDPQRRITTFRFVPEGAGGLTYRPGDLLWADLPLKDSSNRDLLFTWTTNKSTAFRFERLSRLPRLHRKDQDSSAGDFADGVVLIVQPERGLPRVPDLLPVVRLEKR